VTSNQHNWGRPETLTDHAERHVPDFGNNLEDEYAKQANDFYNNRNNYDIKVDKKGN